jgi:hypothetical protein
VELLPGGSIESGIGVEVDSILSSVAERRVNGALQEGSGGASRFEFINASVGANYLIDRWYHWMRVDSVLEYDFIVFPLHSRDLFRTMRDTREHYETSPTLQHVVSELGWPTPGEPWGVDEPESAKRLTFAYLDFIRSEAERLGKPIYFQKMLSYDFEELQTESEFFRAVDAWALERGVFVRPPCPKYAASDSHDVRLNALDSHYSAWAHRIVGEDLAAGISTFIQLIYSEKNNTN